MVHKLSGEIIDIYGEISLTPACSNLRYTLGISSPGAPIVHCILFSHAVA